MLEIVQSISFNSGFFVVSVLSIIICLPISNLGNILVKWFLILIIPYIIAYCLYWSPKWLGSHSDQYSSWAPVFINPWYIVALLSVVIVLYIKEKINSANKPINADRKTSAE